MKRLLSSSAILALIAASHAYAIETIKPGHVLGNPTSVERTPTDSSIVDILKSPGAAGAAARNMGFLDPRDPEFGAKCDGSTNDYTALQAWASSAAENVTLVIPPGKCMTNTPIVFPVASHYSVIGSGATTSSIVYTGAATSVDILQFGTSGGSAFFGVTLKGFNIRSNTTMTGGYALHALGMSSSIIQDVFADAWNTSDNNGKLCGGFWFDGVFAVDIINPNMSSAQSGCGDGIKVNNASGFTPGAAEVRIIGGNIGGNPGGFNAGLHMAGGFGGLRCDGTNIAANKYGLLVDNAQAGEANREFAQGSTCVFDNNVLAGARINDTLANGGSGGAGGTLDFAGWTASTTTGHGIEIIAWANSDVEIRGNKLYNNCGSGLYVADTTTYVKVDAGVSINNNGNSSVNAACPAWQASNPGHGFGIEAASSTSRIFSFASMWGNAGGNTNSNSNVYDWTQQGAGLLSLSGNGDVQFGLNAIQTSHSAAMYFMTNGAKKWQLGKDTDETFRLWDAANGFATAMKFTTLGNIDIGEGTGTTLNLKINALQVNGTAGVTCSGAPTAGFTSTNGVVTHC